MMKSASLSKTRVRVARCVYFCLSRTRRRSKWRLGQLLEPALQVAYNHLESLPVKPTKIRTISKVRSPGWEMGLMLQCRIYKVSELCATTLMDSDPLHAIFDTSYCIYTGSTNRTDSHHHGMRQAIDSLHFLRLGIL